MRIALLALLILTGCAPEPRAVNHEYGEHMPLPKWGWVGSYMRESKLPGGEWQTDGPHEIRCLIEKHKGQRAIDFCGFEGFVEPDHIDFEGDRYKADSFFYGPLQIAAYGKATAEGGEITARAFYDQDGTPEAYVVVYKITHDGEVPDAAPDESFAPVATRLRETPDEIAERLGLVAL